MQPYTHTRLFFLLLLIAFMIACATTTPTPDPQAGPETKTAPLSQKPLAQPGPALARDDFNRLAALLDQPLFWEQDQKNPGKLDADELVLLGVGSRRQAYVNEKGAFTLLFQQVLAAMKEMRRRESVALELNQGRPTLVFNDFTKTPALDQTIVRHITAAARIIEKIHAEQLGADRYRACIPQDDMPSRALFRRNQTPWCVAPATENDPFCNACPAFPARLSGLYPAALQAEKNWCDKLAKLPAAKALLDPFTRVEEDGQGGLLAVPYTQAYGKDMKQIAAELKAAAQSITEGEEAFKTYLLAAAKAFENNIWGPADEAWAAMNASNSRWYLRIAPDEVYFEPCNRKAGFHVSFARIDPDSLTWQKKLTPLRQDMEQRLADLIGETYKARQVSVHMPDFIAMVLNAGDARSPLGATIGQSLPNWGKVAQEGRGRTVVMSNLYTDADSRAIRRAQAESLLSSESMQRYTNDKRLGLLDIILHEITHNFGPHSDYTIDGKRPSEVFGGAMATVLEELKAQTGALFFVDFLREKGLLSQEEAEQVYLHSIVWAFGHISRGMFSAGNRPKPYSQLAAIQMGVLSRAGAIEWSTDDLAANGRDRGRFHIHFDKVPAALTDLMKQVGQIKASGDKKTARKLVDEYVTGEGSNLMHQTQVAERILRFPKASFVYSVGL